MSHACCAEEEGIVGAVRGCPLAVAVLQIVPTLVGLVQLLLVPQWYAPMLENTVFAGQCGR